MSNHTEKLAGVAAGATESFEEGSLRVAVYFEADPVDPLREGRLAGEWDSKEAVRIGRRAVDSATSDRNLLVLCEKVSRRHCSIEAQGREVVVIEEGSSNGTEVDGIRLADGGRVTADQGAHKVTLARDVTLWFFVSPDPWSAYANAVVHAGIGDALIRARASEPEPQLRGFVASRGHCLQAWRRALSLEAVVSALLFDVDDFRTLNARLGWERGTAMLRDFSVTIDRLMSTWCEGANLPTGGRWPWMVGRLEADRFVVVVLAPKATAMGLAAYVRGEFARALPWQGHPQAVPKVTIGVVEAWADASVEAMLDRLGVAVEDGKERGGDCVVEAEAVRRRGHVVRDEASLEAHLGSLSQARGRFLIGFRIECEDDVVHRRGRVGRAQWWRELRDDVAESADTGEVVGTWADRYVVVLAQKEARATRIREAITRRFEAREAGAGLSRKLCHGTIPLRGGVTPEQALAELAERVDIQGESLAARLPFPFVAHWGTLGARQSDLVRVTTLCKGVETTFKVLTAAFLASLRRRDVAAAAETVRAVKPGQNLTLGVWHALLDATAKALIAAREARPTLVRELAARVLALRDDTSRELVHLVAAVRERNAVQHSNPPVEDYFPEEERRLRQALDALLEVVRPLTAARMIAIESLTFEGDLETMCYKLVTLTGPDDTFSRDQIRLAAAPEHRLHAQWVYLADADAAPVCLAPVLYVSLCKTCRKLEAFIADSLVFGPEGERVRRAPSLLGRCHDDGLNLPWSKEDRDFYEALQRGHGGAG